MPPKRRSASPMKAATMASRGRSRSRSRSRTPKPKPKRSASRGRQRGPRESSPPPPPAAASTQTSTAAVPALMRGGRPTRNDSHSADTDRERNAPPAASARSASKLFILAQMLVCVAGIYLCFSMWSLKQERLMTKPYGAGEYFPTVFGVSLTQNVAGFVVAFAMGSLRPLLQRGAAVLLHRGAGKPAKRAGHTTRREHELGGSLVDIFASLPCSDVRAMMMAGFATAFGTTLGYAAMRRLSFPVVLATKMSKMVPVMVVGFLVYRTRYSWRKVASCAMITVGILSFYLMESGGAAKERQASTAAGAGYASVGFLLLFANLFLDGFANSTQDVLVRRHGWSGTTLMLATNLAAALWGLGVMLLLESSAVESLVSAVCPRAVTSHFAFHDMSTTARFLQKHTDARRDLLAMSMLNAVGQIFIFQTISLFGTLTVTAMTLVRKASSVLLSIFFNGHAVSAPQWAALALVMASVVFEAYVNVTETAEKRKHLQQQQQQQQQQQRHRKQV